METQHSLLIVLLLAGQCGVLLTAEEVKCPEPPDPKEHMQLQVKCYKLDCEALYECDEGYKYTGTSSIICQTNSRWQNWNGICKEVRCPDLPKPPNSYIRYSGKGFRDKAAVICNNGYAFSNPNSNNQTCQANGTWSSQSVGQCQKVYCPPIPNVENQVVSSDECSYQSNITIQCKSGYVLHGPNSITCQADGHWSKRGECVWNEVYCPPIPNLKKRVVSSDKRSYQSNITLHCTFGYVLQGPNSITCQADGKWSRRGECVWNELLLLLLLLLLVIPVIAVFLFMRKPKQKRESRNVEEQIPLNPQDGEELYHCSFIMKKRFDAGNSVQTSPQYTSFAVDIRKKVEETIKANSGVNKVHVEVTYISQLKRRIYLNVLCANTISKTQLQQWIPLAKDVLAGSVKFRDQVSASLATEIMTKEHVVENCLDAAINLDSQYVRLRILSNEEMTTIQRDEIELPDKYQRNLNELKAKDISDEDLITPGENFIVIRGRAGVGKTTLMQRLMRRWAHGEWATHLKAIFLLNMGVLAAITSPVDVGYILTQCGVYRIGCGFQSNWLKENEENIGIVLDGLDEIDRFEDRWTEMEGKTMGMKESTTLNAIDWCISLLRRESLPKATLIITSRPFAALNCLKYSTMVEVMGLTRERVMRFIETNVKHQGIDKVILKMKNNPILMSVSAITFYCAALCRVLQDDKNNVEKLTTYTEITTYIMKDFMSRSMRTPFQKQDSTSIGAMCQMAYQSLLRGKAQVVFHKEDYKKHLQQVDVHVTRKAGLFLQTEIPNSTKPSSPQVLGEFVHLCIQELMAVVGLLMQAEEDIIRALDTVCTSGQFNMTLLFLYGFVFNSSSETIHNLWLTVAGDTKVDMTISERLLGKICDMDDELLLLQIVHESQSPKLARKVGEDKFPDEMKFQQTKLTAVDILAIEFLLQHHPARSIKLCNVGLDIFSIKELTQFLKSNRSVTSITLKGTDIDDQCVQYLADLLKVNEALEHLDIDSNKVTDEGVTSLIEGLKANSVLTHLRVDSDSVRDKGVGDIADMLDQNGSLTELEITSNSVTDKGVVLLASALAQNQTLKQLILPGTSARDEGVKAILEALKVNKEVTIQILGTVCNKELTAEVKTQQRIIGG